MTENPAGVPIVGPGTPYITPALLTSAATGISWSTIPNINSMPEAMLAEQLNICQRATSDVDSFCNWPLRATVDTETFYGPGDFRCQLQPTGVGRLLGSRGPVTGIVAARISSAAAFPRSWQTIPADQLEPEIQLIGVYGTTAPGNSAAGGQAILLAPGWLNWGFGRLSSTVEVTYTSGWPHTSLTAASTAGTNTLTVDDITAWTGAVGILYDDSGQQESFLCTAVTPTTTGAISGPGTLTLQSNLTFNHQSGILASSLPATVQEAAIYFAVAQALTRGATATAVQALSGGATGGGPAVTVSYKELAQKLLKPYQRRI